MSPRHTIRSSGWLIVLSFVGASALSSCTEQRDFSTEEGSGGTAGADGTNSSGGATSKTGGDTGEDPQTNDGECIEGATRSCSASPLNLEGTCAEGTAVCQDGEWQGCPEPEDADTCEPGNDDDCDGTPNGACTCTDDETQPCGHEEVGVCKKGTSTCEDSQWQPCQGNIDPDVRDCSSADDNDCDGSPDNTLDAICKMQCPSMQIACGASCIDPASDEQHCGATGSCEGNQAGQMCAALSQCINGSCRVPDGAHCSGDSDCIGGKCTTFYQDKDGDGFGAQSSGTAKVCGSSAPSALYVTDNRDCCDQASDMAKAKLINPDYPDEFTSEGAQGCAKPFDWNCDGSLTYDAPVGKACSSFGSQNSCPAVVYVNSAVVCGAKEIVSACAWVEGQCMSVRGSELTVACY